MSDLGSDEFEDEGGPYLGVSIHRFMYTAEIRVRNFVMKTEKYH